MNDLTPRQRKIGYGVALLLLSVPIIWLGRPASVASAERAEGDDAGGVLSQKRQEYTLGESSLGDVDPSSSTMNLVLFGLRGVATNVLWTDAMDAKDKKDWARLRSDVDSITLLQPHFEKVWDFQGWNLAYNVAAEWDNVEDRWYWVKEGTKFVMDGVDRNARSPDLRFKVAQIMGQKIGNADEKSFYRRYFAVDPDDGAFQGGTDPEFNRSPGRDRDFPHHHLGSKAWYEYSIAANDDPRSPRQTQMTEELYKAKPAEAQRQYAAAIEEEGTFGDLALVGWRDALAEWRKLGKVRFASRFGPVWVDPDGAADFDRMADDVNRRLEEAGAERRVRPAQFAAEASRMRKALNFDFWERKAESESLPATVAGRDAVYEGKRLFYRGEPGDHALAAEKLIDGLAAWEQTFAEHPDLTEDNDLTLNLAVTLIYLRESLRYSGRAEELPPDVPLFQLWEDIGPQGQDAAREQFDYEVRYGKFEG